MNSVWQGEEETLGVQDAFRGKTSQVQSNMRNEGTRIGKKKKKKHKHSQACAD